MGQASDGDRQGALRRRMIELEGELARVQQAILSLGSGTRLPGLYLLVEAAGHRALLSAAQVLQVTRLVAFDPLPSAPPGVLGVFACRGQAAVAIDLALLLGVNREPDLDAHIVVFAGAHPCGLVVDEVRTIVESPALVQAGENALAAWDRYAMTVAWCESRGEILPLISPSALATSAGGAA